MNWSSWIKIETVVPENKYFQFSYAVSNIRAIVEREIINLWYIGIVLH